MNTEDMFKSLKKYSSEKPYLNTEMGQYAFQLGFEESDKCATKAIIEKACEWLLNIDFDGQEFRDCDESFNNDLFVNVFRKAMKE